MATTQIKGNQIQDGSITNSDIDDSLEKDFTKVRTTTNDSTADFLYSKISAGENIIISVSGISGSNQSLVIAATGSFGGGGGSTGPQGYQGDTGVQGSVGSQGSQGSTGSQGPAGPQGAQGFQGSGAQGSQGSVGLQGAQGTAGAQGAEAPSAAPLGSSYIVVSSDATLTNERSLTAGKGITITDGGVNSSITVSGKFLGGAYVESGAYGAQWGSTITVACPIDGTIPQLSEGKVILTTPSYTTKSATSKLKISAHVNFTCPANYSIMTHIHRDSVLNAEAATRVVPAANYYPVYTDISYQVASPGANVSLLYKVVVGATNSSGVIHINGDNAGVSYFGGALLSTLSVEEFEQ